MSASQDQTPLSQARGTGTTYGPDDTTSSDNATSGMSVRDPFPLLLSHIDQASENLTSLQQGSATAFGHGDHPNDKSTDDSNATLSSVKGGPQQADLDGEQMRAPGEGEVMNAQYV